MFRFALLVILSVLVACSGISPTPRPTLTTAPDIEGTATTSPTAVPQLTYTPVPTPTTYPVAPTYMAGPRPERGAKVPKIGSYRVIIV